MQFVESWRNVRIAAISGSIKRSSDPSVRHINQQVITGQARREFRKLASFDFATILILGEAAGKVDEIGDRGAGAPGLNGE